MNDRRRRAVLLLLGWVACDDPPPSGKGTSPVDDTGSATTPPTADLLDACDADATTRIVGEEYEGAGNRVAWVPDVDGDGGDDLAVSSYYGTRTCIYPGSAEGALRAEDALSCLFQVTEYEFAGTALDAGGDLDGDGTSELLIGAIGNATNGQYAGAIYVLSGPPPSGEGSLAAATTLLLGENAGDYAGQGAEGAGDVNGDGFADLLVGADGNDQAGNGSGKAYLLYGPLAPGVVQLADVATVFVGEGPEVIPPPHGAPAAGDGAGRALGGGGDVDGDGLADLLLGLNGSDRAGLDAGAIAVLFGPVGEGTWVLDDAGTVYLGSVEHPLMGDEVALLGDLNGDGRDDIMSTTNMDDAGRVWVLPGARPSGVLTISASYASFTGSAGSGEQAGYGISGGLDMDGDGAGDLVIGAPFDDTVAVDGGRIYLVRGPFSPGNTELAGADGWDGVEEMDYAGRSVALGDGDADGRAELAWGAYFNDAGGYFAGSACVAGLP